MGGLTKNGRHLEWVCCQQSGGVKGNKRKRVVENMAWRNREGGREGGREGILRSAGMMTSASGKGGGAVAKVGNGAVPEEHISECI